MLRENAQRSVPRAYLLYINIRISISKQCSFTPFLISSCHLPFINFYHPCHPQVPPHGRVCMMDFLQAALSPTSPMEARSRVGSESMKPLAEALIACCEDSDPKVMV